MKWYLDVLKKYAVFKGRARRKEYWYFVLFHVIFTFVLVIIDIMIGTYSYDLRFGVLSGLYLLAVVLPGLGVSIRRLHDTNRSGWWILIGFIPIIGAIVLLLFVLQSGTSGDNRYGPDPKGAAVDTPSDSAG